MDELGSHFGDLSMRREVMSEPFLLLPDEIWERVLENLMNSQDILNFFLTYPMLDGRVMKNRYEWLIDKVMPHVFPWLDSQDVLTCRKVSRRWNRGVDTFLENHPQHRGYDFESPVSGQLWIPEASKAYYSLESRFKGLRRFTRKEMFTDFMADMCKHMPTRNPFVGRSVIINDTDINEMPNDDDDDDDFQMLLPEWDRMPTANCGSFWKDEALPFLGINSAHIRFLDIGSDFDRGSAHGDFCNIVFRAVSLLPNLRGLKITLKLFEGYYASRTRCSRYVEALEAHQQTSPSHPQLESLEIHSPRHCESTSPFIQCLLRGFSSTLKRLKLSQYDYYQSDGLDQLHSFPKLTELAMWDFYSKASVNQMLAHLRAPQLRILELEVGIEDEDEEELVIGRDIVSWLEKFPKLHSFTWRPWNPGIGFPNLVENERIKKIREYEAASVAILSVSIPSLKSFVIYGEPFEIDFNFLRCFPSLEYLKIEGKHRPHHFRKMNMYGDIWERLPNLKEMNISPWKKGGGRRCFNRAKYGWLKNTRGEAGRGSILKLDDAFEGFNAMIEGIWRN